MNIYDRQLEWDGRILHRLGLMLQRQMDGETVRPVAAAAGPVVFRCAWCDQENGVPKPAAGSNVSHGICDRHRLEFKRQALDRRLAA